MSRHKCNYKARSNNRNKRSEPQTITKQQNIFYNNPNGKRKQLILHNVYKKNWNSSATLAHCTIKNLNTSTMLKKTSLRNAIRKYAKAKPTLKSKNLKELQENSNIVLPLSVSQTKAKGSEHILNKSLSKYKKNRSALLHENSNNKKNSNKSTFCVTKAEHKATRLQNRARSYKNSNMHNNLCTNVDEMSKKCRKTQSGTDLLPQKIASHKFNKNLSRKQSLKIEKGIKTSSEVQAAKTNVKQQNNSKINLQDLIDTEYKASCNMNIKNENTCDVNSSKEGDSTQGKTQRSVKSICHLQTSGRQQQNIHQTVHKYKQQISKIEKSKFYRESLRKQSTNNISDIAVTRLSKNDIVMYKNCIDNKQLIVPLIKIENLSKAELSNLIHNPNYVENRPKKQEDKEICYKINNTAETIGIKSNRQRLTCNQYRTTELKQNEEINVLFHKSMFKKSHTFFKENLIQGINTEINNVECETDLKQKHESSSNNEDPCTRQLIDNKHKLENTHLLRNILQFFLKHKKCMRDKRTTRRSNIINLEKKYACETRKCVAMCIKCKEVFNLLQQFSAKTDFLQDEELCIDCTLCNRQIKSLSSFQQHVMDIHLQCKGKSSVKKKFAVDIVNLSEQGDLNSNNKFNFECCCCSKIFYSILHFQKHIKRMHYGANHTVDNLKDSEAEKGVQTSELYAAHKNKPTSNKAYFLNGNLIFDSKNDMQQISDQGRETNTQNNNHINEYCIYYNSNKRSLLKMEVKKQQILNMKEDTGIPTIKQNMGNFNFNKKYTTPSSNVSEIAIISKAEQSNTCNSVSNKIRFKTNFPYTCNICSRNYKKKYTFLSHISKHVANSNINAHSEQSLKMFLNDRSAIKFENNVTVENLYLNESEAHSKQFTDSDILNSSTNLQKINKTILIPEAIDNGICNSNTRNIECVIEKNSIPMDPNGDCTYVMHINLIHKTERGIKRQKSIKFDISITKKCKMDTTGEGSVKNEIENEFPISLTPNNKFMCHENGKDVTHGLKVLHCYICNQKFNSLTILKEHMFFLHDSLLENLKQTDLIPYFTDFHKSKDSHIKNTHKFVKKHDALSESKILNFLKEENKTREKKHDQIARERNINNTSKKWRCNPCKENFALLRNYLRHKYYYHNDESVVHICDNCNKVLTSVAMVNIHICTNVSTWHCKRCNFSFSNALSLTRHNMNFHLEIVGPHTCHICHSSFLTTYMLKKHMLTHSIDDSYNNLNNSQVSSVPAQNLLPFNVNNINTSDLFDGKGGQPLNNVTIPIAKENAENCEELSNEINGMHLTPDASYSDESIWSCKFCNVIFSTMFEMKLHLEKLHDSKMELCQICNNLYLTDELTQHLIHSHIISDTSCQRENNINIRVVHEELFSQKNILQILGLKRLLSLYEYQRFDDIPHNKHFMCVICSKEFSNIQCYKVHYFEHHDMICLLCNIEFEHDFQAFEHKIKIHMSIDLYMWVIQKLILAILQLSEHGSTIEEVILKCSEIRIS